ncbi:MAG: TonB-dependent receptor [Deltaproteobacteria bacterium]|nr:TonB-dependent receptor [Deltaproteobacteria bacterium]
MRAHLLTTLIAIAGCLAVSSSALAQQPPTTLPPAATAPGAPVLVPPEVLRKVDPVYPEEALRLKKSGDVVVQLDIDDTGKVTSATVHQSAGFGMDEAAQAASLQLQFRPATRNGSPVRARILYKMSFTLKQEPAPAPDKAAAPPSAGRVRGRVLIGQTDAPMAGARVQVQLADGRTVETTTNADGVFELDAPAGKASVQISAPGYATLSSNETVTAGEEIQISYRVRVTAGPLEVRIQGERPDREVTRRTMERKELSVIPGTSGDAIKAVQTMPGVARTPMFGGMIVVRGSSPYGTATFVDGTWVPMIYHFGGLSSIVPTEMIEAIDFYPGNFSARYGRVTGGIIDVRLREMGTDGKYHGLAQVDLIDARVMLRGPVPLLKNWSFNLAGRRSHVDAWIGSVMSSEAGIRTAPVYYDWQAFMETKPTAKSTFRIGMFGADDRLEMVLKNAIEQEPGLGNSLKGGMRTARLQAFYKNTVSDRLSLNATASIGLDKELSQFGSVSSVEVNYIPMLVRGDVSYRMSKELLVRAGPDVIVYQYDADVRSVRPPEPGQMEGTHMDRQMILFQEKGYFSAPAGFAEMEWTPTKRAKVLLGGRVDYFDESNKVDISPRLNARYDLTEGFPRTTVKAGVGMFYEPPQIIQVIKNFGTPGLKSNRSIHSSVGIEQELSEEVEVSVEAFHKSFDQLVVPTAFADGTNGYANTGEGYSYGTETLIRWKPVHRFFGWIAYTNSRSMRRDAPDKPIRLFEFDQSHILSVMGSYDLGRGWRVGGRFRLVTGNPYTPCEGGILNTASSSYECIQGDPYSRRVPSFHQLDARVDKNWKFESWNLTAYLDVQNVYNRSNVEGVGYNYNFTRPKYQSGLPIIPSLGVRGEF